MKTEVMTIRGITMYADCYGSSSNRPVILLHGFTGSAETWQALADFLSGSYFVVALDLIGHGRTDSPDVLSNYRMEEQVENLHGLFQELGLVKPVIIGYSMGGRVALSYAAAYPDDISGLILESSSPGLRTEEERKERRRSDGLLAERIEKEGIEKFVDFWQDIPLFDSQKNLNEDTRRAVREERLNQCASGLANSLRGMGTGSQPSCWDELIRLDFPVLLLTGSEDQKFENIAREMIRFLPNAVHESVAEAGHAIHVEKPRQFATMVESYLKTL